MAQATLTNGTVQATCAARELAGVIVTAPNAAVEDRQRRAIFDRCGLSNQRARVQYVSYSGVPKGGVEAVDKMQLGMQAWSFTTQSLDELIFPEELLRSPETYVAVAVAPMQPANSPWGTYGVIVVGYVDTRTKTADAGGLSAAAR